MTPSEELLFLPLGGAGEIGMNVNLYGCRGRWLMVDLGMTFATPELPGIDLVLPDLTFVEGQRDRLEAVVLTHGHEDHIGAVPYLAADLGVPLYATPFTAGLVRRKLDEAGLAGEVDVRVVPLGGALELGPFRLRYVALAHSIPEGNALVIDTPFGRVFHTGDWKLDDRPLIGDPASEAELRAIGDAGVLALVGDSTNVFQPEASGSEAEVRDSLLKIVAARSTGRVVVTTFASNAVRLRTLGEIAEATGRRLVLAGRSLERVLDVAREAGYLADLPPSWGSKRPPRGRANACSWRRPAPRANRRPRWRAWRTAPIPSFASSRGTASSSPRAAFRATNWRSRGCRTTWPPAAWKS